MKLRLTPLNIVIALGLAVFVIVMFQPKPQGPGHSEFGMLYKFLLGGLIIVAFVCDLIFRFTLKDLKRIWIVETIFITLAIVLFLILQK
jgi:hypothetical protein